ncbi:MAG: phosphate ABC transporter ATP-binding protein [Planctomycetales bacterium]|nr:phosphate ABC transporter ATP-binding protein [Planctomycetales bacterium]
MHSVAPVVHGAPAHEGKSASPVTGKADSMTQADAHNHSIRTENVSLWYGNFQALKNVTINIRQGIITGLIGPSGCGKTTLLRSFNRINERYGNVTTTGEIRVLGKNIYDDDVSLSELRKSVGMVFQRPNPLPISVYENVMFGLRVHSRRREISRQQSDEHVEHALQEVKLWDAVKDRLKKKATLLTLEQQQKLCIARLLPLKPRVILMDEPCSALDAEGIEKVEEMIGNLREKYTVVIVTHNMAQARRATDECIYMLLGEIVEHADTSQLFLNPQKKETEMYIEGRYG